MGRIWAVTSGNGGVGKTTIALSLAAEAARQGHETILLDAAGSARACDLALGLENVISMDLIDVVTQQTDIQSALYPVPGFANFRFSVASLSKSVPLSELSGVILALQSMCDVLVMDMPTGNLPPEKGMMTTDDTILMVVSPEDASMRAAERLLEPGRAGKADIMLIVNHVRRDRVKKGLQYTQDAVAMTLDCLVAGSVPEDERLISGLTTPKSLGHMLLWGNNPMQDIIRQILSMKR